MFEFARLGGNLTMTPTALGLIVGAYAGPAGAQDGFAWLREPGALDRFPLWALFLMTILVLLLPTEVGLRSAPLVGRRSETEQKWPLDEIEATRVQAVQAGKIPEGLVKSEGLQNRLWAEAAVA
jgi:hypothetical protein